jgi:CheY-like chemotaxis protein
VSQKPLQNILYVDDANDIAEIAKLTLESLGGYTVEICNNGRDALRLMSTWIPDLVLLDVMMPILDGPGTLSEMKKNLKLARIPVVFMTAKVHSNETNQYSELGAADVITKPFDPMMLCDRVDAIWRAFESR